VAGLSTPDQAQANKKGDMLTRIFAHDPLYWAVAKVFTKQLMELMGADEKVVTGLTSAQRALFDDFINYMNPVSLRSAGAAFDNQAIMPGGRIAAITAPTLIFHAADDTLQLYHNAEFAVSTISNAKLIRFERGGHFLIGLEQSAIREGIRSHILNN
jgi:pimeloyl-ACP methyl ester carboxylesterase